MINVTSARGKQKARAEILRAMTLLEVSGAREIRPILVRQFLFAARLTERGVRNIDYAVNKERARMVNVFKRHYRRTATTFNQMAMGKLGKVGAVAGQSLPTLGIEETMPENIEVVVPEVKGSREDFWAALNPFIAKETAKRVTLAGETTKKRIKNVIKRGMVSKLSNREIAKNLRSISGIANAKRAKMIARTETHSAAMHSIDESVKSAGVKTTKDWIAANDERSRDIEGRGRIHVKAMATQKKIPDDKPFIVGGEKLMYPGDFAGSGWNIIHCRCAALYDVVKAAAKPKKVPEGEWSKYDPDTVRADEWSKEVGDGFDEFQDREGLGSCGPVADNLVNQLQSAGKNARVVYMEYMPPGAVSEAEYFGHYVATEFTEKAGKMIPTKLYDPTNPFAKAVQKLKKGRFPKAYSREREIFEAIGRSTDDGVFTEKQVQWWKKRLERIDKKLAGKVVKPRLPVGRLDENAWVDSLDRETAHAFKDYTGTVGYSRMRSVQIGDIARFRAREVGWIKKEIELMEKALKSAKPYDKKIYRGLRFRNKSEFDQFLADDKLTWRAFTSGSKTKEISEAFAYGMAKGQPPGVGYGVLLEIKNKSGVLIRKLSAIEMEGEVLMRKGARYRVVKKIKKASTQRTKEVYKLILEEI